MVDGSGEIVSEGRGDLGAGGDCRVHRGKGVCNIDPPASSNAIMQRRLGPTCGANSEPGRRIRGELDIQSPN